MTDTERRIFYEDMTDDQKQSMRARIAEQLAELEHRFANGPIQALWGKKTQESITVLGDIRFLKPWNQNANLAPGQMSVIMANGRAAVVMATDVYINGEPLVEKWPPFKNPPENFFSRAMRLAQEHQEQQKALHEKVRLWMKAELDLDLDCYLDNASCAQYTALAKAAARAHGLEQELDDESSFIWDLATSAFDGRSINH